jgi:hypothetical protein
VDTKSLLRDVICRIDDLQSQYSDNSRSMKRDIAAGKAALKVELAAIEHARGVSTGKFVAPSSCSNVSGPRNNTGNHIQPSGQSPFRGLGKTANSGLPNGNISPVARGVRRKN